MAQKLEESDLLDVAQRKEWRAWLEGHYQTASVIWLVYHKKHTGQARISYNDAVEEALCFGWIDSTVRKVDEDRYAQKFSPRSPKSPYSQANIERLRALADQGRVMPEVLAAAAGELDRDFIIPADILAAVQADAQAWQNFQAFSPTYIRIRVAFIEGARDRPAEFARRLAYFLRMTARNKLFGFGGIEKYY